MDIDKQQVLELLYDAIEREDWSLVEEAIKVYVQIPKYGNKTFKLP